MPTLYVENVPEELYEALRKRARSQRRSIAAEVLLLLEHFVPTEQELRRRQQFTRKLKRFRDAATRSQGGFATAEELIRQDRSR